MMKKSNLPSTHPSIAVTHRCIGDVCLAQGRLAEALQHCKTALEIELNSLQPHHPSLSMTYRSIGSIYYASGQNETALDVMTTALAIARQTQSVTHPNILDIQSYITKISERI
jgi:hypothetical protein